MPFLLVKMHLPNVWKEVECLQFSKAPEGLGSACLFGNLIKINATSAHNAVGEQLVDGPG